MIFLQVRELTLAFITNNSCSFRLVENKDFRNLISYVSNDRANIPTAKTLITTMDSKYELMKQTLKDELCKMNYLCLTADVWTNKARSFIGISVHYFDQNLIRKSYLLAFRRLYGRHTHDVLAQTILSILKEFNISSSKISHIVTDGASNFRKAFVVFGAIDNDKKSQNAPDNTIESEEKEIEIEDLLDSDADMLYIPPDTIMENINLPTHDNEDEEYDNFSTLPQQLRCPWFELNWHHRF